MICNCCGSLKRPQHAPDSLNPPIIKYLPALAMYTFDKMQFKLLWHSIYLENDRLIKWPL
jgi:hypothetical protein